MLSQQIISYIGRVVGEGYHPEQIKRLLVKKGFDQEDVEEAIANALKKKGGRQGLKNRIEEIVHRRFLGKSGFIAAFAEKMLRKGYAPDQIEKVLVSEGHDAGKIRKVIPIVEKRHRMEQRLHEIFEEVAAKEHNIIERYEILHHEWIKLGIVAAAIMVGLASVFFAKSSGILEATALAAALSVALPTGAYIMHHMSSRMHSTEVHFRDAFRYLAVVAVILLAINLVFPAWAMLAFLVPVVYLLAHTIILHHNFPGGKAYVISFSAVLAALALAYGTMAAVGLLIGFYSVAL